MNISGSSDLDSNSVAVWWIDLDTISEDQTRMLRGLLPSDETARIDRLLRPIDRKRSIVAHAALRLLLSRLIGLPNSQLAITRTTDGKPIWPQSGYEFSLSHSGRRVVLAISQGPQVGIDVEEHRHFSDLADMIPLYFHAGEAAELMALAPARREDGFFTMWCAKEAVVKALGQGLRSPLSGFQISNSGGELRLAIAPGGQPSSHWALHAIPLGPDYRATLAIRGNAAYLGHYELAFTALSPAIS